MTAAILAVQAKNDVTLHFKCDVTKINTDIEEIYQFLIDPILDPKTLSRLKIMHGIEELDYTESRLLRKQYWRLSSKSQPTFEEALKTERPITCFLHPKLTPSRLYEHLRNKEASEACILYWMRRLQEVRGCMDPHAESAYAVELMSK